MAGTFWRQCFGLQQWRWLHIDTHCVYKHHINPVSLVYIFTRGVALSAVLSPAPSSDPFCRWGGFLFPSFLPPAVLGFHQCLRTTGEDHVCIKPVLIHDTQCSANTMWFVPFSSPPHHTQIKAFVF